MSHRKVQYKYFKTYRNLALTNVGTLSGEGERWQLNTCCLNNTIYKWRSTPTFGTSSNFRRDWYHQKNFKPPEILTIVTASSCFPTKVTEAFNFWKNQISRFITLGRHFLLHPFITSCCSGLWSYCDLLAEDFLQASFLWSQYWCQPVCFLEWQ